MAMNSFRKRWPVARGANSAGPVVFFFLENYALYKPIMQAPNVLRLLPVQPVPTAQELDPRT